MKRFCLSLGCLIALLSPVSGKPTVQFCDATQTAGLRFQHRNAATAQKYLLETMAGGVAVFDYDNDGWLDVFFTNGAKLNTPQSDREPLEKTAPEYWNRLFRNNRDGTFTDVTEKAGLRGKGYGMGVAAADYDNDGDTDLLVTTYGAALLDRNNGDGTFTEIAGQVGLQTDGWLTSAGFFDYDRDGWLDLFICRYVQWDFVAGSQFCGNSQSQGRGYCHPDKFKPIASSLFKNNGDGTFTDVSAKSGIGKHPGKALGVAFADFNGDGWPDISVANDSFPQFLFRNNGDGTFTESALLAGVGYNEDGKTFAGMGTDLADIDDDGFPDIVTTALPYEYFAFFHNERHGSFRYFSTESDLGAITRLFGGWSVRVFDYDNDGAKDLFCANSHVLDNIETTQPHLGYRQKPLLLRFDAGKFVNVSATAGEVFGQPHASRGAAIGDLDNDGDLDIVLANCNEAATFLRNDGGNQNHWIGLALQGSKSNRDGIGAKISLLRKDGKTQYAQVTTTAGYLSAQDRRVFFGLGQDPSIQQIRIEWPSGIVQLIAHPKPDQFLQVKESVPGSRRSS